MGQNIETIVFREILEELVEKYRKHQNLDQNQYSVENNENLNEKTEISYL